MTFGNDGLNGAALGGAEETNLIVRSGNSRRNGIPLVDNSLFNDRIEKKYHVGIEDAEVGELSRDLTSFLKPYGLERVQEITSIGSLYFENEEFDILRYSVFGPMKLFRVRAYETYSSRAQPITEYWVEVKTAEGEYRNKKRFKLPRSALAPFLEGQEPASSIFDYNTGDPSEVIRRLYDSAQETLFTLALRPLLLVVYKRTAFQNRRQRLSIDWDIRYYHAPDDADFCDSWKSLKQPFAGKSRNVILELKYLYDAPPLWFPQLQQSYPIRRWEYLKPVEGMGFLFDGPLKEHKLAGVFAPLIAGYLKNSQLG